MVSLRLRMPIPPSLPVTASSAWMLLSVACLVFVSVVLFFPFCLAASVYKVVAWHRPRIVILGLSSSVRLTLGNFPSALTTPLFLVVYALVLVVVGPCVVRYLKKYARERVCWRPILYTYFTLELAFADDVLVIECWVEKSLERLCEAVSIEGRLEAQAQAQEVEVEEERQLEDIPGGFQENPELHGHVLAEQERAAPLVAKLQSQEDQPEGDEQQVLELTAKNEGLESRIQSVSNERDALAAERKADLEHFEREREMYEAQRADLQGSLDFANAEHRIHVAHCEQERTAATKRSEEDEQELEQARRTHAAELAAVKRAHDDQVSSLQAKNEGLQSRVTLANATRDAVAASYRAQVVQKNEHAAVLETQYMSLEGSLEFATVEHRMHVQHCERERAADKARIEELIAKLAAQRAARVQAQADRDELKNQNVVIREENVALKAQLEATELELQQERQQCGTFTDAGRSGSEATTCVQSDPLSLEQPSNTLPPSTLFTPAKSQPEFAEGSSRDDLSPFSAGIIMATSTPWHPRSGGFTESSGSISALSDMDLTNIMDDQQTEDELSALLASESAESFYPSPPASGSTSTCSDMSLASTSERSPHIEIRVTLPSSDSVQSYPSPPPSGSTSSLALEPSLPPPPSILINDGSSDSLDDGPIRLNAILPAVHSLPPLPPTPTPEPSFLMPDSEPPLPPPPDISGSFLQEEDSSADMLSATGTTVTPSFLRPTAPRLRDECSTFGVKAKPSFSKPSVPRRRPRGS